jgi:pyruvate-formate lyase-activating enzyme
MVEEHLNEDVAPYSKSRATSSDTGEFVEPPFLSQVGLFLTFRCTIRCRHCMVGAGPHRTEEVDLNEAIDWLYQIVSYSNGHIKSIGFTGGEPFCCWDKLLKLAHTTSQLGLPYSVITNGFWAKSKQKTRSLLTQLQPSDVSISTDVYHAEYIPVTNVGCLFEACQDLGIRCDITLAYEPNILNQTASLLRQILSFAPRESIRATRVFPSGRGESQADFCGESAMDKPPSEIPCLFATVPYILPNGDIIACIGPIINLPRKNNPLFLGSLRERLLAEIFDDSQDNPVLHGLRIWGPRFWHRLVEVHGPKSSLPEGYFTDCPCEGCIAMLKKPDISAFLSKAVLSKELRSHVSLARQTILQEAI